MVGGDALCVFVAWSSVRSVLQTVWPLGLTRSSARKYAIRCEALREAPKKTATFFVYAHTR